MRRTQEQPGPLARRRCGALLAACLLAALLAPKARGDTIVTLEPVALTGTLAPGAGATAYFGGFERPLLGEGGITFGGILSGVGVTPGLDHFGLWQAAPSQAPALVVRQLDETDGGDALVALDRLVPPEVPFYTLIGETSLGGTGIWRAMPPDPPVKLAQLSDVAPGTGGATFSDIAQVVVNSAGEAAFTGSFGAGEAGLWRIDASGSLSAVAVAGDTAPGVVGGAAFLGFETSIPHVLADSGALAFTAWTAAGTGIWSQMAGAPLVLEAYHGDAAPGAAPGETYLVLDQPLVNAAGEVAFRASLQGPGVTLANDFGLWGPDALGAPVLKVREGDAAPGAEAGTTFGSTGGFSLHSFFLTDSGTLAFGAYVLGASVTDANDTGIWLADRAGTLTLALREGDAVEGLPAGVAVGHLTGGHMNHAGQIAMETWLTGPGVDATNDGAILLVDPPHGAVSVIREGDALEVAPGDVRTVQRASMTHLIMTRANWRAIDEAGRLAMKIDFTDGSEGVFIATVSEGAEVPGLGAVGAVALGVALAGGGFCLRAGRAIRLRGASRTARGRPRG